MSAAQQALDAAKTRWPRLSFELPTFERFLETKHAQKPTALVDLVLVDACLREVSGALEALEVELRREAKVVAAKTSLEDDLVQRLFTKLIVGEKPRLATYSGRGSLAGWLRAAAVREFLNMQRGAVATMTVATDEPVLRRESGAADGLPADLRVLQARHADTFKEAFRFALASLEPKERDLIRLHLIDNVSLLELSKTWSVHRTTLARWLDGARHQVVERTRERLSQSLQLSRQESDSLTGFLLEQVDVSLSGLRAG